MFQLNTLFSLILFYFINLVIFFCWFFSTRVRACYWYDELTKTDSKRILDDVSFKCSEILMRCACLSLSFSSDLDDFLNSVL